MRAYAGLVAASVFIFRACGNEPIKSKTLERVAAVAPYEQKVDLTIARRGVTSKMYGDCQNNDAYDGKLDFFQK